MNVIDGRPRQAVVLRFLGRFRNPLIVLLVLTGLGVVAVALALPCTPVGARLGLVRPPAGFPALLAALMAVYLGVVEVAKRWFYRRAAARCR